MARFKPPGTIPIEVQAHLEGVLYCADAATDQLVRALVVKHDLRRAHASELGRNPDLTRVARLADDRPCMAELCAWHGAPIVKDARQLRNHASHAYYTKSLRLEVQPVAGSTYNGSRIADEYCLALVDHLEVLVPLIVCLRDSAR